MTPLIGVCMVLLLGRQGLVATAAVINTLLKGQHNSIHHPECLHSSPSMPPFITQHAPIHHPACLHSSTSMPPFITQHASIHHPACLHSSPSMPIHHPACLPELASCPAVLLCRMQRGARMDVLTPSATTLGWGSKSRSATLGFAYSPVTVVVPCTQRQSI